MTTNDDSEQLKHILGHCMCTGDNRTCWYWTHGNNDSLDLDLEQEAAIKALYAPKTQWEDAFRCSCGQRCADEFSLKLHKGTCPTATKPKTQVHKDMGDGFTHFDGGDCPTPKYQQLCRYCGHSESRHIYGSDTSCDELHCACSGYIPEKVSMQDVVGGTPEGQAAVQRALEAAAKAQEAMHDKATLPKTVVGDDGRLDELLDEIYQDKNPLGDLPLDRNVARAAIQSYTESIASRREATVRHEIAQTAPNCAHTLKQQAEHEAVCGFINGIWTHWAIKNKVSIRDGVPVFAALTQSKEGDINEPTN